MKGSLRFKPTAAMELYAYERARSGDDATIVSIAEKIGISRETVSRWKKIPEFAGWLDERVAYYRAPITSLLEQVAISKLDDFRYWEAMALKYGYIAKQADMDAVKAPPAAAPSLDQMLTLVRAAKEGK